MQKLLLTPEEVLVLHAMDRYARGIILGTVKPSARAVLMDHLPAWSTLRDKIVTANHERETGMARPHSDKVFIHAGLRPEAHKALYAHLEKLGGGSIKPGAIGDWLSDAIESKIHADQPTEQIADSCSV